MPGDARERAGVLLSEHERHPHERPAYEWADALRNLAAAYDALARERDEARADYDNCAQYRDRIIEIHQHDMDALRDRLMAEHLGNSSAEDARVWEKRCSEAEDKLHEAEDAAKERHARFAELWKEAESLRSRLAALEQENAGLRAELAEKARDADGHGLEQDVVKAAMALFTNDGRLAGHGHLPPLKAAVARLREELEPRP